MCSMKIRLDTTSDVQKFVKIANTIQEDVFLKDSRKHCVNAKSLMGCLYSLEFEELYVECVNNSIVSKFDDFTF